MIMRTTTRSKATLHANIIHSTPTGQAQYYYYTSATSKYKKEYSEFV